MNDYKGSGDDYKIWILCYEKNITSNYLGSKYYLNKSLEVTVLLQIDYDSKQFIFYYDTSRFSLPEKTNMKEVNSIEFYKLIPSNFDLRNTKYTLSTQRAIGTQTRELTGVKLNVLPPDINQKLSYCRNVSGVLQNDKGKNVKRYISPYNAKITDSQFVKYEEYIQWCKEILITMKLKDPDTYFSRYANKVDVPHTEVTSLTLELDIDIINTSNHTEIYLDSQSVVVDNNKFSLKIAGKDYSGIIENSNTEYAKLEIEKSKEFIVKGKELINLKKYINNGNFRMYFSKENIMFSNGIFFSPNIQTHFSQANNWPIWKDIFEINGLCDCEDEKKGDGSITHETWPPKSVFRVLIDEIKTNYKQIDYLICDDLNTEFCDFIALSTSLRKVYYIHCKHKKKSLSASDFQDVCGQAIKNLHIVLSSNTKDLAYWETHKNRWENMWNMDPLHIPRLVQSPFIIDNKGKSIKANVNDFVNEYKNIISSIEGKKEVWIVQSGLSKGDFEKELINIKQQEQIPQIIWFLQTTQDTLSNANAEMKIFCRP